MFSSEEKVLRPLASNPVLQAATQERPKRARKPNSRFTEDPDATASLPRASRKAWRRKAVRLSARKNQSAQHSAVDDVVIDVEPGKYRLEDPPAQWGHQCGMRNVYAPTVCGDHIMEPSPGNNETSRDGEEPTSKRPRTSPMDMLFAAVEKVEGDDDYWTREEEFCLLGLSERALQTTESSQPLPRPRRQKKEPQQPSQQKKQPRGAAAKSAPKPSKQPTMGGTCQRTVGCDKGSRHTGFCKAHKVNSRENRILRALAKE